MKDSCPACFSNKIKQILVSLPLKVAPDEMQGRYTQEVRLKCRRCGWEGQKDELVSTRKFSVTKMGKIKSRLKRIK